MAVPKNTAKKPTTKVTEVKEASKIEEIKEAKQVPVVREVGNEVVVTEKRKQNVFDHVGRFVRRTWKPILGGVLAFGAGILTALALSGGNEEPDDNDEDEDDYSILDEE